MRLFFILMTLFQIEFALAADTPQQTHALMTQQEQDIHMRAKKRLYPGGRDEDSLKVQSQLPQVTRKMGPATEAPQDEETEPAAD